MRPGGGSELRYCCKEFTIFMRHLFQSRDNTTYFYHYMMILPGSSLYCAITSPVLLFVQRRASKSQQKKQRSTILHCLAWRAAERRPYTYLFGTRNDNAVATS